MKKTELIDAIAARTDLTITKKDAKEFLNVFIEEIQKGLKEDGLVQLTGFGTWKSRYVEEKQGKNPKNPSQIITIPARHQISFSAGANFKNYVNGITTEEDCSARKEYQE